MMPLTSYRVLLQELEYNAEKRANEGWYIFLLMNPLNKTNAGIDLINNLSYLNRRTKNVTFFLPGFSNMPNRTFAGTGSYGGLSRFFCHDASFFDENGFLDTVEWLEEGSDGKYQYSEGLDLVLVKYDPELRSGFLVNRDESHFDRERLLFYHLDDIQNREVNIPRLITECMRIVSRSFNQEIVKRRLDEFISGPINSESAKTINVFVAGAKKLERERDAVIAALNFVNGRLQEYYISPRSFEDFDRTLVYGGRQEDYNSFIRDVADYVIFILDNSVGAVTLEEFSVAMDSYMKNGRPLIHVYSRKADSGVESDQIKESELVNDVQAIRKYLSDIGQYYTEYLDLRDLRSAVIKDYLTLAVKMTRKI